MFEGTKQKRSLPRVAAVVAVLLVLAPLLVPATASAGGKREEITAVAQRFATALNERRATPLEPLVDVDALIARMETQSRLADKTEQAILGPFHRESRARFDRLGRSLLIRLGEFERVAFVKLRTRDKNTGALLRVERPRGLSYLELRIEKIEEEGGKKKEAEPTDDRPAYRVVDVYDYDTGVYESELRRQVLAEILTEVARKHRLPRKLDDLLQKLTPYDRLEQLIAHGDYDAALELRDELPKKERKERRVLLALVRAAAKKGGAPLEEAVERFDRIYKKDPSANVLALRSYLGADDPAPALAALRRIEGDIGRDAYFDYLRGELQRAAGNHTEAEQHYRDAIERDPGVVRAYATLAHYSLGRKDAAGALAQLDAWCAQSGGLFEWEENPLLSEFTTTPAYEKWRTRKLAELEQSDRASGRHAIRLHRAQVKKRYRIKSTAYAELLTYRKRGRKPAVPRDKRWGAYLDAIVHETDVDDAGRCTRREIRINYLHLKRDSDKQREVLRKGVIVVARVVNGEWDYLLGGFPVGADGVRTLNMTLGEPISRATFHPLDDGLFAPKRAIDVGKSWRTNDAGIAGGFVGLNGEPLKKGYVSGSGVVESVTESESGELLHVIGEIRALSFRPPTLPELFKPQRTFAEFRFEGDFPADGDVLAPRLELSSEVETFGARRRHDGEEETIQLFRSYQATIERTPMPN